MADVQIDNGDFTRIANEIIEHIAKAKLNGTQHAIVLVIWRYTYGFQRKEADLSLSFLSEATGYDKRQIQRELKELEERGIIIQTLGQQRKIGFNKNYDSWIGKPTNGKNTNGKNTKESIGKSTNPPLVNLPTKKESLKDIKENIPFQEIVDHLNQVCNKNYKYTTETTKKHIRARWNEGQRIEQFNAVIDIKASQWMETDMEKYLRPETLFGTKFEGYLNEKPKPPPNSKRVLML